MRTMLEEGVKGEDQDEDGKQNLLEVVRVDPEAKRKRFYQALQSILKVYGPTAVEQDEDEEDEPAAREAGTLTPSDWVRKLVEKADKDVKLDTAIMSTASDIAPGILEDEDELLEKDIKERLLDEWNAEHQEDGDADEDDAEADHDDEMNEADHAHQQVLEEQVDEVDICDVGDQGATADVGYDRRYLQKYGLFEQLAERGGIVEVVLKVEDPGSDSDQMSTDTIEQFLKKVEDLEGTKDVFHPCSFRMFDPALRENKDIVEAAVRTHVHNFEQASIRLRLDTDFILDRLLPAVGAQVYQYVWSELSQDPAFATRFLLRADAMYESREKEVAAAATAEHGEETPDAPAELLHKAGTLNRRFGFGEALSLGAGGGLLTR
eukprot:g20595.t1